MGIFCKHEKSEVVSWKYENIGKPEQQIKAKMRCTKCGKEYIKVVSGERMEAFSIVYEDRFRKA